MQEQPEIGALITTIAHGINWRFDQFFRQYELTYPQYRTLIWLFSQPEGSNVNQQALCNALCVKPSSVSSLVRNLEKKGYITTVRAKADIRNKWLRLTDKALELQTVLDNASLNGEAQLCVGISEADKATLTRCLEQILENLEAGDSGPR